MYNVYFIAIKHKNLNVSNVIDQLMHILISIKKEIYYFFIITEIFIRFNEQNVGYQALVCQVSNNCPVVDFGFVFRVNQRLKDPWRNYVISNNNVVNYNIRKSLPPILTSHFLFQWILFFLNVMFFKHDSFFKNKKCGYLLFDTHHDHVLRVRWHCRCIKPNESQVPDNLKDDLVADQLKCNGLLEIAKIRKYGYAIRLTPEEFLKRSVFIYYDIFFL